MKIGILTYYNVHNHGAVLQANALRKIITSLGYQCQFLTFDRDYSLLPQKSVAKYKLGIKSILFYAHYLYEKGIGNIVYNINKRRLLNRYRRTNLPLGERYDCFDGYAIVIGSDEVFSLEVGINPFFYGNGLKTKKVISYAGSFGATVYDDIEKDALKKMISDGLNRMEAISVRDRNSQNIVKKLSHDNACLVCDPVILYGYRKEMKNYQPPLKDYLVIYSYDKNMNLPEEIEEITKYAKDNHLMAVSVGYYHKWCRSIQATPVELLGWIKNAKLVLTDTFHGAVMSIICNTPMLVKIRGNQNKLLFLLEEYELNRRVINDFSKISIIAGQHIDFDSINKKISEHREKSIKFLQEALGCNNNV